MGRRKANPGSPAAPYVRVKLHIAEDAVGPGKIDLLRFIETEGGISAAARRMGVTYRRAWHLVDTMNSAFGNPVVETAVGGDGGGGARLTPLGRELIANYDELNARIEPAARDLLEWVEQTRAR